jgi:hypothetical protein
MSTWADYAEPTSLAHIAWCLEEHGYRVEDDQKTLDRLVVRDDHGEHVATIEHVKHK